MIAKSTPLFWAMLVFLTLLALPLCSAQVQTLGNFVKNANVTLIQTCVNSSYSNLTRVVMPDSKINLSGNFSMFKQGDDYFYYFPNTNQLGTYLVYGVCDENGVKTAWQYDFKITNAGSNLSTSQGLIYIVFFAALVGVFGLCLYGAVKIEWRDRRSSEGELLSLNDLKYLKIFLWVMSYVILMFIFGVMRSLTANFLDLDNASHIFNFLFWIMFYLVWPLVVLSFLFMLILFINGKKLQRAMDRGIRIFK